MISVPVGKIATIVKNDNKELYVQQADGNIRRMTKRDSISKGHTTAHPCPQVVRGRKRPGVEYECIEDNWIIVEDGGSEDDATASEIRKKTKSLPDYKVGWDDCSI